MGIWYIHPAKPGALHQNVGAGRALWLCTLCKRLELSKDRLNDRPNDRLWRKRKHRWHPENGALFNERKGAKERAWGEGEMRYTVE